MKIIFFGSSPFSIPALEACLDSEHEVSLVISTPDRKRGRGLKVIPTVVKKIALNKGLEVVSPESLKDESLIAKVTDLKPELFVVSSYGKFIPSTWLKIPSKYSLNVHPSLLPKYRGAAPINWPIINGDTETGVSIMEVTKELDAGDIFYQYKCNLDNDIDAEALGNDLAKKSYEVLSEVLKQVTKEPLPRVPQEDEKSCYARKLSKEDGIIDWAHSATQLHNQIRGLMPWPTAYTYYKDEPLQLIKASVDTTTAETVGKPGELMKVDKEGRMLISTADGNIWIELVKPSGKKIMKATDFINGQRLSVGHTFESKPNQHILQS